MIPLATTSISVVRTQTDPNADPYDGDQTPVDVASNVRAIINMGGGSVRLVGGQRVVTPAQLVCDPIDLRPGDTVTDDQTGQSWTTLGVSSYPQLGLSHLTAQLRITEGAT